MHGVLATRIKEEEGATFKFTHLLPSLSHRKAVLLRGILWWTSSGFTLSNIHLSNPHIIPKKIAKTNHIYITLKRLLKILFLECLCAGRISGRRLQLWLRVSLVPTEQSRSSTRKLVRNLGTAVGFWVPDLRPEPPGASRGNWTTLKPSPDARPDFGAQHCFWIPENPEVPDFASGFRNCVLTGRIVWGYKRPHPSSQELHFGGKLL